MSERTYVCSVQVTSCLYMEESGVGGMCGL